jgi:hypothetical protein
MSEDTRVRISLNAGDLEVQGSEAFVGQYASAIQELIARLKDGQAHQGSREGGAGRAGAGPAAGGAPALGRREFGEVLHGLPNKVTGPDQILIAGAFAQEASGDNTFSTGEANQLLIGQGVKLSNPSQALKNAIAAKRVFKVGARYRVSKTGEQHLQSLIGE